MFAVIESVRIWWRQLWCKHYSSYHPDFCDDCGKRLRPPHR
jgi:hypothetical protein